MKTGPLIIGIIVVLAILCSPGPAISTSDLISQYQSGGFLGPAIPIPTPPTPSWFVPSPPVLPVPPSIQPTIIPTTVPTQVPQVPGDGTLSVTSTPAMAMVYLDGVFEGFTPLTIDGVSSGAHQLEVTRWGYEDYSTGIMIPESSCHLVWWDWREILICEGTPTTTVDVTLEKVQSGSTTVPTIVPTIVPTTVPTQVPTGTGTGAVSVSSTPTGATVYLDGLDRGTTPTTITGVSPGLHRLKVTLSGYHDYSTGVVVQSGKTAAVFITQLRPVILDEYEVITDIPSRKPNIYLYSDRDLTAQVQLAPEEAITVSEPAYQPGMGWRAEVRNGSLNGAGDFLFYEALVPDSGWQKKEGYVIRAAYREQDMASMLGEYGFSEKETVEFIDYWASHLPEDMDYVLYPQETDAVDKVMPLYISPQPDEVSRIWFYAEPFVSAPEPVTSSEKIVREGFYVVEWGVMVQDE